MQRCLQVRLVFLQRKKIYWTAWKNLENVQFIPPLCLFQIYLRFLEYQMENSNECKKNFVAVYDGSNAIEDLKVRIYCLLYLP